MASCIISTIEKGEVYKALRADMKELDGAFVKVGFPANAEVGKPSSKGSGHKPFADISEVARIAIWNEFGVPGKIPARPFFRAAIDTNRDKVRDFQDRLSMDVMVGAKTPKQALESLGLFMEDKIKKSLTTGAWAPNAPRTIKAKGSSRPLIDSGQMRNSVTFTTHKKGEPCEAEGSVVI